MDADVQDLVLKVKSSDVREQILQDLYNRNERVRPSKILETLEPKMDTSSGNFYMNLGQLNELGLVNKIDGDSRATLYSLTDKGNAVAEELEDEWEQQSANEQASLSEASSSDAPPAGGPPETGEVSVDPEFVRELAFWLANRSEGVDEVIEAAWHIKQNDSTPDGPTRASLE